MSIDIIFCGHYNDHIREVEMCEQSEIIELHKIYQEMDAKGRKKITLAASQLLKAQKSFEDNPDDAKSWIKKSQEV